MAPILRPIQAADAEAAARLAGQLGYPVEPAVMAERIRALDPDHHAVFVACLDGQVVGWIDVGTARHLQSGCYAEIGGLVVSDAVRNQGIGAALVRTAEKWAVEHRLTKLLVRSQIAREDAHRFYLREGYTRTKTSAVFTKDVIPAASGPGA